MVRSEHSKYLVVRSQRGMLWTGACMLAVLLAAFTGGCSASVHPTNNSTTQPPPSTGAQTFGILGTVSPVTGGSGAVLTLSGAASATATANSAGAYTFTGLAAGTYAVTPSKTGFTFSPTTQAT